MKTCFNGVFADANKFNKEVNYLFLGCGTEEQMGTKKMVDSLRELGIRVDYESVERVRQLIESEKKRGVLILLASHNEDDIQILADHVFFLENGSIVDRR